MLKWGLPGVPFTLGVSLPGPNFAFCLLQGKYTAPSWLAVTSPASANVNGLFLNLGKPLLSPQSFNKRHYEFSGALHTDPG